MTFFMRKIAPVPKSGLRMVRILPACGASTKAPTREAKEARRRLVLFLVAAIEIVAVVAWLLVR